MERVSWDPTYFTWHHHVQADVKDCNSQVHTITVWMNFFLYSAQFSVSFDNLVAFLYAGKPD